MTSELFVEIGFGQQTRILKEIKEHSKLTWDSIAESLTIKRRMIFHYLRETHRMRFSNLLKLCKKTGFCLETKNIVLVKNKWASQREIIKPLLNEELAEFLGAMSGDGNIYGKNNRVSITCGFAADYKYVNEKVKEMFQNLFGIEPTIISGNGRIRCQVYSKKLAAFLSTEFGFTIGNRKNKTKIPKSIARNKKFLASFLRGLFDTDGSFHRKRKNSGVVEYISCSPNFLQQIKESLILLGFKASLSGKSVYIYDQRQLDTFFNVIKPSNNKHTLKYKIFNETGKVPTHKEYLEAAVVQR